MSEAKEVPIARAIILYIYIKESLGMDISYIFIPCLGYSDLGCSPMQESLTLYLEYCNPISWNSLGMV